VCYVTWRMVWSFSGKQMYTVRPASEFYANCRLVSQDFNRANLLVSVTGDQDGVYKDEVIRLSGNGPMKPTLLLIGKRLGHDNVNPLYYRSLKVFFNVPVSKSNVRLC